MKTTQLMQANKRIEQQNALLEVACITLSQRNKKLYKQCKMKVRCSLYNAILSVEYMCKRMKRDIKLLQNKAMSMFLTKEKVRAEIAVSETDTRKYYNQSIS